MSRYTLYKKEQLRELQPAFQVKAQKQPRPLMLDNRYTSSEELKKNKIMKKKQKQKKNISKHKLEFPYLWIRQSRCTPSSPTADQGDRFQPVRVSTCDGMLSVVWRALRSFSPLVPAAFSLGEPHMLATYYYVSIPMCALEKREEKAVVREQLAS